MKKGKKRKTEKTETEEIHEYDEIEKKVVQPTIYANELYDKLKEITGKKWSAWTKKEKDKVIQVMKCRASISFQNGTKEAQEACNSFIDEWVDFVENNPGVRKLVDPWYVCFSFGGQTQGTAPHTWDTAVTDFNLIQGMDNAVPTNRSNFLYTFTGRHHATAFAGYMKGKFTTIQFTIFESVTMHHYS
jgi:hypothetical protein